MRLKYANTDLIAQIRDFVSSHWKELLGALAGGGLGAAVGYFTFPEEYKGLGAGLGAIAGGIGGYYFLPTIIERLRPKRDFQTEKTINEKAEARGTTPEEVVRREGIFSGVSGKEQLCRLLSICKHFPKIFERMDRAFRTSNKSVEQILQEFEDEINFEHYKQIGQYYLRMWNPLASTTDKNLGQTYQKMKDEALKTYQTDEQIMKGIKNGELTRLVTMARRDIFEGYYTLLALASRYTPRLYRAIQVASLYDPYLEPPEIVKLFHPEINDAMKVFAIGLGYNSGLVNFGTAAPLSHIRFKDWLDLAMHFGQVHIGGMSLSELVKKLSPSSVALNPREPYAKQLDIKLDQLEADLYEALHRYNRMP